MLARTGIWTSMVAFVAALAFGTLGTFEVGLSDPAPRSDDINQRIIDNFEEYEEWYLQWGRWEDLALALGFAGLLICAPFLPESTRSRHLLITGAGFAVLGELIDLSKLGAMEVARIGLDNGLGTEFSSGNTFRYAIDTTSIYVWAAGLLLLAICLIEAARHSNHHRWRMLTFVLSGTTLAWATAVANEIAGPWPDTILPEVTHTLFTIALVLWGLHTSRILTTNGNP